MPSPFGPSLSPFKKIVWIGPRMSPFAASSRHPFSVAFRVETEWHGERWYGNMLRNVANTIQVITEEYRHELQKELFRHVGSIPASGHGHARRRIQHSRPGEVPYWQTGNLRNSIRSSYNFKVRSSRRRTKLWSRISTPVHYARQLERGGKTTTARRKPFTTIRLVNPLRSNPIIAPRPLWLPVFQMRWRNWQWRLGRAINSTPIP